MVNPPNAPLNGHSLTGHSTNLSRTTTPGGSGPDTFTFPPVSDRNSHSAPDTAVGMDAPNTGGQGGRGPRVYSRDRGRPRLSRGGSMGRGTAGDSNFLARTSLEHTPGPGVGRGEGSNGARSRTGAGGPGRGSYASTIRPSSRSGHPVLSGSTSQDDLSYPSTSDGRTHGGYSHQFSDVHIGDIPHLRHNLNF